MRAGVGVLFMVISMFIDHIKELHKSTFINLCLVGISGIFLALSISGFTQAGFINVPSEKLWIFRTIFGMVAFLFVFAFVNIRTNYSKLELYNISGILSDGLGGVFLILLASFIYPLVGFTFVGVS